PGREARPAEDRPRDRAEGAKAACQRCGYLEGGQISRHRDWHGAAHFQRAWSKEGTARRRALSKIAQSASAKTEGRRHLYCRADYPKLDSCGDWAERERCCCCASCQGISTPTPLFEFSAAECYTPPTILVSSGSHQRVERPQTGRLKRNSFQTPLSRP